MQYTDHKNKTIFAVQEERQ